MLTENNLHNYQIKGRKAILTCENCGTQFERYLCYIKPGITHFFCSRACAKKHLSEKMAKMNKELNPTRMSSFEARLAVRKGHLKNNTGEEHSYPKLFGTHEHRVLAEKILGRPLKKGEIVHHKDGNIRNNSLDNLEVISSQSEHFSLHLKGNKYARKK